MSNLQFLFFGPPRIKFEGGTIDLRVRKAMALLTYLAVTKGEYSRDELATLLWPESNQSSARASLRRTLYLCLLYTSPSPRDATLSRMPSSA